MMQNDFRVMKQLKDFIFSLDELLILFPKTEKVLKDKIKATSFDALECLILANIKKEHLELQQELISKLSMLDFYLEIALKKQYISIKQCKRKCEELEAIAKMTYGWIKNGT